MNPKTFYFPTIGTTARQQATLLAIDDYSLPLNKYLCYYLTKPQVRQEPVLRPDPSRPHAPDALGTHFYGTVLMEDGKFGIVPHFP